MSYVLTVQIRDLNVYRTLNRKKAMSHCFTRPYACAVLLVLAILLSAAAEAPARQTLFTYTPDGRPFLLFDIYDTGEMFGSTKFYSEGKTSTWTLQSGELDALRNGVDYWATLIGSGVRNTSFASIITGTYNEDNAGAISFGEPFTELADALINGRGMDDAVAQILLGHSMGAPHRDYLEMMEVLPHNGDASHLAHSIAHELGHAMGMVFICGDDEDNNFRFEDPLRKWEQHLLDSTGKPALANQLISDTPEKEGAFYLAPDGYAFFQGVHVSEVLQGANLDPSGIVTDAIPINGLEEGWDEEKEEFIIFPELSHPELRNSMMSHQSYRNWTGYMEAEIAILQDIGYQIDRKNLYGYSVYGDELELTNTNGYSARNAEGTAYIPNQYNTTMMGIGLHIYGSGNTVTQAADILSAGYGGAGVRVDGLGENTLTIHSGIRVHAHGERGTALMVAYGKDHVIVNRGDLSALGPNGVGARFDFGSNVLGNLEFGYRGSYIFMEDGSLQGDLSEFPELQGPLVERFDVTGSVTGTVAAIYISDLAYVKEINIMNGASLSGDVTSLWNPKDRRVQYTEPDDLMTDLSFGRAADAGGNAVDGSVDPDFRLAYRGNISGPNSLNMNVRGGELTYIGQADVANFRLYADAVLAAGLAPTPTNIHAEAITMESGSVVTAAMPKGFMYGPELGSRITLLELNASTTLDNQSVLRPVSGVLLVGPYDYTYDDLRWDNVRQLSLGLSGVFNAERGGTSAVTGPSAIHVQNPASRHVLDRLSDTFTRAADGSLDRFSALNTFFGMTNGSYAFMPETAALAGRQTARLAGQRHEPAIWLPSFNGGGELRHGNSALWVTPGYTYARQYGRSAYDISSSSVSLGYDQWFSNGFVLGLALSGARPEYRSSHADIDGWSYTGTLYGGAVLPLALELGVFATYGRTEYEQTRKVLGHHYDSDYDSEHWSVGAELGRSYALADTVSMRPFVSYEYMRLDVDGYAEDAGLYALHFGSTRNELHRLLAGGSLTWDVTEGASLSGRAYYAGLYGDRRARAEASFVMDQAHNTFTSTGDPLDKDSLGLGLGVNLPLMTNLRASVNYNLLTGKDSTSHQVDLSLVFRF